MEFLIDFLFEIIVDGSIAISESKKAPMPLRILACFICIALVGVVVLIIHVEGYDALILGNTATAITFYVIGSLLVMIFFYIIYKQFRERNNKKEPTVTEQVCEVQTNNLKTIKTVCIVLCALIILSTGYIYLHYLL